MAVGTEFNLNSNPKEVFSCCSAQPKEAAILLLSTYLQFLHGSRYKILYEVSLLLLGGRAKIGFEFVGPLRGKFEFECAEFQNLEK